MKGQEAPETQDETTRGHIMTDEEQMLETVNRLDKYIGEITELQNTVNHLMNKISKEQRISQPFMNHLQVQLKTAEQQLNSIDRRWNAYYQAEQAYIADDDDLLAMADDFQQKKNMVRDSLEMRGRVLLAARDFTKAEKFLTSKDSVYKSIVKNAGRLSLTSKTASKLESLKIKEQLIFADIQASYDSAKNAAGLYDASDDEQDYLDNLYALLKNKSETIQAMEYKPFIGRIKDSLTELAAVAIIMMFFNLILEKIKAAKKLKDSINKYNGQLKTDGHDDVPSI